MAKDPVHGESFDHATGGRTPRDRSRATLAIGTAGWSVPAALADRFPGPGSHLARYARHMNCVEIDTSFHRPHRTSTYQRWAESTPPGFRFSVKFPRRITHERRLSGVQELLDDFLAEVAGLGEKLGVLLLQLPPSLAFDARACEAFLERLRARHEGALACEPRHASWASPAAEKWMSAWRIARVATDPAVIPQGERPGGWLGSSRKALRYYRWHGSPRTYWSRYDATWLAQRAADIEQRRGDADCWCIFDNTASGFALVNALEFRALQTQSPEIA